NMPFNDRYRFTEALMYYAFNHPGNVYHTRGDSVDFTRPFKSADDLNGQFVQWDSTVTIDDPNNPGSFITAPIKFEKTIADIYAIRFYEDWYYDPKTMMMTKIVHGVSLILITQDYNGNPLLRDAGIYIKTD
ncbi:MAG TPA: hypothetical protein VFU15_17345, partial [Bacteroidia bacterium]|nr:hypothetical protein [Bacteroidia bacterium]